MWTWKYVSFHHKRFWKSPLVGTEEKIITFKLKFDNVREEVLGFGCWQAEGAGFDDLGWTMLMWRSYPCNTACRCIVTNILLHTLLMLHTRHVSVPLPNYYYYWSSVPADLIHIALQGRKERSVDKTETHISCTFASLLETENTGKSHRERCSLLCLGLATGIRRTKAVKIRF